MPSSTTIDPGVAATADPPPPAPDTARPSPASAGAGRRVARGSAWYLVAGVLNKAVGFALLPIYTTHLTSAEYGAVAAVVVIGSFLHLVCGGALTAAVTRYFHAFAADSESRAAFLGTILTAVFAFSVLICGLLLVGGEPIFRPLLGDVPYWPLMAMALGVAVFQPYFDTCLSILQTAERPVRYVALAFGNVLVKTLLAIWLVVGLEWSGAGILGAHLITAAVFFVAAACALRGLARFSWRTEALRQSVRYALPLLLHTLSSHGRVVVDRILIVKFLGAAATGIYHVGFLLATVTQLATVAGNKALNPVLMRALHQGDRAALANARNLGLTAALFYCWIAIGVSWFASDVLHWLAGAEFYSADRVVALLALTCVAHGIYGLLMTEVYFDETRSKRVGWITLGCLGLSIGLGFSLIPRFGILGAAWSALISQTALLGWAMWMSRRVGQIDWPLSRIVAILAITTFLATFRLSGLGIPVKLLAAVGVFALLNQVAYGSPLHLVRELRRAGSFS